MISIDIHHINTINETNSNHSFAILKPVALYKFFRKTQSMETDSDTNDDDVFGTFHKYITKSVTVNKHWSSEKFDLSFASSSSCAVLYVHTPFPISQISSTQQLHHHHLLDHIHNIK